jgi:hypothetical protein
MAPRAAARSLIGGSTAHGMAKGVSLQCFLSIKTTWTVNDRNPSDICGTRSASFAILPGAIYILVYRAGVGLYAQWKSCDQAGND